jgi:hypothetical protein
MIPLPTILFATEPQALEAVSELAAPVVNAAERLRLATEAAEAEKTRAAGELRRALLHLGCAVADDDRHRDHLARLLYWGYPMIPVRDIVATLAFADQRSLTVAAGPVDTGIVCKRCAKPLVARNRSSLTDMRKDASGRRPWSRALVCQACREEQARADAMSWEAPDPWGNEEREREWLWDDEADLDPAA